MFLAPETELGPFEIIRLLGVGGMGEVYAARDRQLNRSVALKVLRADVVEPHRHARFEQEARAASALNHPNICHTYQRGETPDGRPYIAMEYVEGETLDQRLVEPVSLREALDIAIQIASALTAAHSAGIVHRDIKPGNVIVRPDRLVKVLDFGLAKLVPSATAFARHGPMQSPAETEPGSLVGTPDYMSPEQARGHDVDARTDIWALGVLLYEMVAGRHPFAGSSRADVLVSVLDREPAPLTDLEPHVPAELQRIVHKALRKDPEQRYQVMKDLLLDLEALRDEVAAIDRGAAGPRAAAEQTPLTNALARSGCARRVLDTRGPGRRSSAGAWILGTMEEHTHYTRAAAQHRAWHARRTSDDRCAARTFAGWHLAGVRGADEWRGASVVRSTSRSAHGHATQRDGRGKHSVFFAGWTVAGVLCRPEAEEGSRDWRCRGDARGRTGTSWSLVGGGWHDRVRAALPQGADAGFVGRRRGATGDDAQQRVRSRIASRRYCREASGSSIPPARR